MVSEGKIRQDPATRGDAEKAMKSIKVPILYMPSETDLHFPVSDGRYEAAFIEA
jgi:homoserine O-acetyltransferase